MSLNNQKRIAENYNKYQEKENMDKHITELEREHNGQVSNDKQFYSNLGEKYAHDIKYLKENQMNEV